MASVYEYYDDRGKTIGPISEKKKLGGWRKPKGARLKKFKVGHRDPDGTQRWETVQVVSGRQKEAERALSDLLADIEACRGRGVAWQPPDAVRPTTLGEAGARYLQTLKRRWDGGDLAARTLERKALDLKRFVRFLGEDQPLSMLRGQLVSDWADSLDASSSTKVGMCQSVRQFWEWCSVEDDLQDEVRRPPTLKHLGITRPPASRPVSPSWVECDRCIAELTGNSRRVAIIARFTGLRISQILGLRWEDLDMGARTLCIRIGKSKAEKRGRVVPVSAHLVAEMAGWGSREGLIFPGRLDPNKPMDDSNHRDAIRSAWRAAGVREEAWGQVGRGNAKPIHAFRYALQSELMRGGAEVDAVEHLVGHKLQGARAWYIDTDIALMDKAQQAVDLIPEIGEAIPLRQAAHR